VVAAPAPKQVKINITPAKKPPPPTESFEDWQQVALQNIFNVTLDVGLGSTWRIRSGKDSATLPNDLRGRWSGLSHWWRNCRTTDVSTALTESLL
jgi:hypothetical protein